MSGGQDQTAKHIAKVVGKYNAEFPTDVVDSLVDHPSHYNQGDIEVGDFIEDQGHLGWCRQNAIKYICRSGAKSGETTHQSLKKAIYYLEREMGFHRKGSEIVKEEK